uniref:Uncharacterized protein n=3 Tax=Oryza TaxID=4527 RepID=Q10MV2_ORYSJ|nr:hypothetical protein LOC_Os03g18320 [Oryza sativa Japonica Group]
MTGRRLAVCGGASHGMHACGDGSGCGWLMDLISDGSGCLGMAASMGVEVVMAMDGDGGDFWKRIARAMFALL